MSDVTQLLEAANGGDRRAAVELLPLVYDELRKLAAARMASEKPGQTLDATALVHEAYLRLVGEQQFDGRGHFFAAAAEAMRRILVDAARRKQAVKHGGDRARVDLETIALPERDPKHDLLELDAALTRLAVEEPEAARLVELRHFTGMSIPEAAQILQISPRTADRLWAFARAWLRQELTDESSNGSP
jgi:RNA polymerase sigma factor (TIGR02999 family)